jgi:glycosyltransferase involved in cell wall biosynthesis
MSGVGGGEAPGRVLHFARRWLPASEGFVYDLVRNLHRPGVVVTTERRENPDRFPLNDVHSLAWTSRLGSGPAARRARTAALMSLAVRRHVVVAHAHHGYGIGDLVGAVRRRRLPLVLSLHGDDVTGLVDRHPDYYRDASALVTTVVVPSQFLVDHVTAAGFDAERVRVIPSGVDTSFFSPAPPADGPPQALFVGRFVAKKGLDVLAAAWPRVARAVPAARLLVMGFGELEHLARAIPGNVQVVLSPTRVAVRDAMRQSRVVVSPSRTAPGDAVESLLVVNVEAQASGRPVVTTRHGGIPEYVRDGETALVVPESDPAALADALITVLTDDSVAGRLGAAGPDWVAQFDVALMARRVDAAYDDAIERSS